MDKKLGLSFLLTVLALALIYDQLGARSSWNGTLFIFIVFTVIYILLNHWSAKSKDTSKDGTRRKDKVVDLDQFRKKKEQQSNAKEEEHPESNHWAPLYVCNNPSKMELVYSLLTSYDIECHVSNRHAASLYPSIEGLDMILQVNSKDQERCLEILKKHDLQPEER